MKKIAIVGGGVSGVTTFIELVKLVAYKSTDQKISITIFNPSEIGPGTVYTDEDRYLLNMEMIDMGGISVSEDTSIDDFYCWVQRNWKEDLEEKYKFDSNTQDLARFDWTNKNEYVPRGLYGQYVKARYQEGKSLATQKDIIVHENFSTVENVKQEDTFLRVDYHEKGAQQSAYFDKVIIACGHAYKTSYMKFKATGKYFRSNEKKKIDELNNIKDKSIVIQGTSLSACEIALSLIDKGAKVYMISHHGSLPAIRLSYNCNYTRKFLTLENLEKISKGEYFSLYDVWALLKQEIEYAEECVINWQNEFEPQDIKKQLADRLAFADKKPQEDLKRLSVMMSLFQFDDKQRIYERLAREDKEIFIKKYSSLFFNYIAPMPVKIARKLLLSMEKSVLEVRGGWQACIWKLNQQQFEVSYTDRNDNSNRLYVDYMISADGQTLDPYDIPLLRHMIEQGDAMKHPCGGIEIDLNDHHILTEQGKSPHIYALGPMLNGAILTPAGVKVCIGSARIIAAQIIKEFLLLPL